MCIRDRITRLDTGNIIFEKKSCRMSELIAHSVKMCIRDRSWPGLCIRSGSGAYQHDSCFVRCCSVDYIFSAEWAYFVVDDIFD